MDSAIQSSERDSSPEIARLVANSCLYIIYKRHRPEAPANPWVSMHTVLLTKSPALLSVNDQASRASNSHASSETLTVITTLLLNPLLYFSDAGTAGS